MTEERGTGAGWLRSATGGLVLARFFSGRRSLMVSGVVLLILAVIALLAPLLGRYNPNATVGPSLDGVSSAHFLGTDEFGRDIFSRILFGMRISIVIASPPRSSQASSGPRAGLYGGYFGGTRDSVIMRVADFLLGFPALVAAMIVVAIFGASKISPTAAAILITMPLFARVVRGAVLSERNKEYVLASRALGAGTMRLLARTLLPTVMPLILVQAAVAAALAVQLEAGLSFLGMGVPQARGLARIDALQRQGLPLPVARVRDLPGRGDHDRDRRADRLLQCARRARAGQRGRAQAAGRGAVGGAAVCDPRVLEAFVTLAIGSVVAFTAFKLLPGDIAAVIAGRNASGVVRRGDPCMISASTGQLARQQYFDWLDRLIHGDLGVSLISNVPVSEFSSNACP